MGFYGRQKKVRHIKKEEGKIQIGKVSKNKYRARASGIKLRRMTEVGR